MFSRLLRKNTYHTLFTSLIYDYYIKDFILGFILKKSPVPSLVYLFKSKIKIKIISQFDRMTISEIFGWKIYYTSRLKNYKVILDVGANIGCASVYFANKCKNLETIIAFEPDPRAFKTLKENLKINCSKLKITLHEAAISPDDKQKILIRSESTRYNSLKTIGNFKAKDSIKVNSVSFEKLFEIIKHFDPKEVLLKIDIEGLEYELLKALFKEKYLCDIILEGDYLPTKFGPYRMIWNKFNNIYYFSWQ